MPEVEDIGSVGLSRTYKRETCKPLYITLVFQKDEPKKIDYVLIASTSKANNCSVSLLSSMADLLSFGIRRIRNEHEARALVKNLRHNKCLACPPNRTHLTNCSDAVGQVLEEVLFNEKPSE